MLSSPPSGARSTVEHLLDARVALLRRQRGDAGRAASGHPAATSHEHAAGRGGQNGARDGRRARRLTRPATDFGAPGVVSHFRGPFADGPPASALHVETPPIDKFGVAELRRMVVIYLTFTVCIAQGAARQARPGQRKGSWATAGVRAAPSTRSRSLGPTFVKLGPAHRVVAGHLPGAAVDGGAALPRRGAAVRRRDRPRDDPQGPRPAAVADLPALRGVAAVGGVDRPGARLRAARRARGGHQAAAPEHPRAHDHRPADHAPPRRRRCRSTRSSARAPTSSASSPTSTPTPSRSSTRPSRRGARTASATASRPSATTRASPRPRCTGTTAART